MKLRCTHDRRVVILDSGQAFHRNGDGTLCDGVVSIGGEPVWSGPHIRLRTNHRPEREVTPTPRTPQRRRRARRA